MKDPDFIRADGKKVFVDYQDFSGTGTKAPTDGAEAFLDASSIAAQGRETYDIAGYGSGLPAPCLIRVLGVAPGASLVGLNVFGSSNEAFNSVFLEAINYAVGVDHVNVINESFGSNPFPDSASLDLTRMADDAAVAAGVTVTVSTGDAGSTNTIGSPATDPNVISAGATHHLPVLRPDGDRRDQPERGEGLAQQQHQRSQLRAASPRTGRPSTWWPPVTSTGPCARRRCEAYAACSNFSGQPAHVELQGGTSEASPLTAGTAALVIQAYAEAHGGTDPTPAVVKQIITSTATDIDAPGRPAGGRTDRRLRGGAGGRLLRRGQREAGRSRPVEERQPAERGGPTGHQRDAHRDGDQRRPGHDDGRSVQPDAGRLQQRGSRAGDAERRHRRRRHRPVHGAQRAGPAGRLGGLHAGRELLRRLQRRR